MVSKQQWRSRAEQTEGDRPDARIGRETAADATGDGHYRRTLDADTDEVASFLELLEDEYAHRILEALAEDPRPARELVEASDASRATVYRRLNRLEEHGVVTADVELHPGGHHCKVFESTLVRATIELEDGSPTIRLTLSQPVTDEGGSEPIAAD